MLPTPTLSREKTELLVKELVPFYESLTPQGIESFDIFYAPNATFKDPFNDVNNLEAIKKIFRHMFVQIHDPLFTINRTIVGEGDAIIFWKLHFNFRGLGSKERQCLEGVSHLAFNTNGEVTLHRDYWDAAEELYSRLPLIGFFVRGLQRLMRA